MPVDKQREACLLIRNNLMVDTLSEKNTMDGEKAKAKKPQLKDHLPDAMRE